MDPSTRHSGHWSSIGVWTLVAVSVAIQTSCGGSPTSPTSPTLAVNGATTLTPFAWTAQLSAVESLRGGATQVVTGQTSWSSSSPAIATVSLGGLVTAVSLGTTTVTATYQAVSASVLIAVAASPDCLPYDPATLQILPEPDGTWSIAAPVRGGPFEFFLGAVTQIDANNDLALMQRYTQQCFIGRENGRANRLAYIVRYWLGATGQPTMIQPEDCQAYSVASLHVGSNGPAGWTLMAGVVPLAMLDNPIDAASALAVAQQYSAECFIGRGNTQPNPLDFIAQYWK
jgi:hypothetical protein